MTPRLKVYGIFAAAVDFYIIFLRYVGHACDNPADHYLSQLQSSVSPSSRPSGGGFQRLWVAGRWRSYVFIGRSEMTLLRFIQHVVLLAVVVNLSTVHRDDCRVASTLLLTWAAETPSIKTACLWWVSSFHGGSAPDVSLIDVRHRPPCSRFLDYTIFQNRVVIRWRLFFLW